MTACFKLMKALQPDTPQRSNSLCEPCVYYSQNLDSSIFPSNGSALVSCGLDYDPGDDKCIEMRTNNCGAGKR